MGKKRNSAKTGDQKLYASRSALPSSTNDSDDELHDDKVERYQSERDTLFMEGQDEDHEGSGEENGGRRAVFDLEGDDDETDQSDYSDDSDNEEDNHEEYHDDDDDDDDDDGNASPPPSDSDDESEEEGPDVMSWGAKKRAYYAGDTADLEIGQSEQDAYDEEEAARELLKAKASTMADADFFDEDDDEDGFARGGKAAKDPAGITKVKDKDISKLSRSKKLALMQQLDPTLPPLLSHFSATVEALKAHRKAKSAIEEEEEGVLGTNEGGYKYLDLKEQQLTLALLNATSYLMLYLGTGAQGHPVVGRLTELAKMEEKLGDIDVEGQIKKVIEAVDLMGDRNDVEDQEESEGDEEGSDGGASNDFDAMLGAESEDESKSTDESDEEGLDDNLFDDDLPPPSRRAIPASTRDGKSKKRAAPVDDGSEDEDQHIKAALAAMDADLKTYNDGLSDDDFDDDDNDDDDDAADIEGIVLDAPEDDFLSKVSARSKAKRQAKKAKFAVAPKYPTTEKMVEGERAVGYQIMKNRGLVAHKNKLNRNPRVKKREQYRKALIRRKGAVREVKTGEARGEALYQGEQTGVKSNISRSRKL